MNLYFTVFTLHSLCQYIVVFLGYFRLSRLKPKRTIKTKFLILKTIGFFYPCIRPYKIVECNHAELVTV